MKTLLLQDILPVLQGKVVHGKSKQLITNVAQSRYHPITQHTLIFLEEKKPLRLPAKIRRCTIVSSTPVMIREGNHDVTIVKVANARQAYWRFVEYYRSLFNIPVIGVTGTSGKTTTKEMIAWILSEKRKVVKTVLSHNGLARNLPYLTKIEEQTEAAVFEMGVSGPNQLLYSARYFRPNIGIITKIGTDHMDGFKNQAAYFREKARMLFAVESRGSIIINMDDENSRKLPLSSFNGKIIYFGTDKKADFQAKQIAFNHEHLGMDFILVHKGKEYNSFVPGFGTHNVYNALAALAGVSLTGVTLEAAIHRLRSFRHVKSHLEFHKGVNDSIIIDDTWNTNPISVEAALEVLREVAPGRKKIAVLGDIAELGEYAVREHHKIGDMVVKNKIDTLITIGNSSQYIGKRAIELGMNPANIFHVKTKKLLLSKLEGYTNRDSVILIKTSMRNSFDKFMKVILRKPNIKK